MRIVYFGSPEAAVSPLEFLRDNASKHGCKLVAVVSQPPKPQGRKKELIDTPVAAYAKQNGIECLTPVKASDYDFISKFAALQPDVAITAAYGQILSDEFLSIPKRATINIHPSFLPKYRGATPVPAALLDGLKETGISILFTVKKLDAGNIIVHRDVDIHPDETAKDLTSRLFKMGGELLPEALEKLKNPSFRGEPQNEDEVTHCRKIQKEDGHIDFTQPAEEIYNQFRAYFPWPGSFAFLDGKRINFLEMRLGIPGENQSLQPGEARFSKADKAIFIVTKSGCLKVLHLQTAGSSKVDAPAFWNGLKNKESVVFKNG